jgi:hypothetical protein
MTPGKRGYSVERQEQTVLRIVKTMATKIVAPTVLVGLFPMAILNCKITFNEEQKFKKPDGSKKGCRPT